jgi:phage-related protein
MKDESVRDKVCDEYEEYFYKRLKDCATMQRIINYYKEHGQLRLFCWCAPKRCHAETIKKYIEDVIK